MKKTVRARVNLGYTRFTTRTLDDGTVVTNVTSFQHTDPRGMIPPKLVNATIARAADQLRVMIKYMEEEPIDHPEVAFGDGNPIYPKQEGAEEAASSAKAKIAVV